MSHGLDERLSNTDYSNHTQNTRVAIYARVSSINQTFGYSLDEQIRQCRERCDIMGWPVKYIFKENGKSGKDIDRPQFQMMLQRAELGCFEIVVFWKLDRFCRSLVDLINIERTLEKFHVSLHSVTEQIDTTSPVGRFNFRSLASAAELEREMIKERTRMGMKALAIQHKWPGNIPPLGYDRGTDGRLIINPHEAKIVRKIFKLYLKHKSMPEVAYLLNDKDIKTKRKNPWNTMAVKKILTNELYKGDYSVNDYKEHVKEYRIVKKDIYTQAQDLRFRYRERKKDMPIDRKTKIVDKFINEYRNYLDKNDEVFTPSMSI